MKSRIAIAVLALCTARIQADEPPQVLKVQGAGGLYTGQTAVGQAALGQPAKVTYCGVGTSEVSTALTSHLKLPAGMGLMVDWVEPGSPADRAGLKQYDILLKMNDQKLVNPEQFRTLVRLKKPSDDAKLELIRQGQPTTANVELGQTERAQEAAPLQAVANGGVLNIAGHFAAGQVPNDVFFHRAVPALEAPLGGGRVTVTNINGQHQTQWADDQHSLQLETAPNKPLHVIVRDKAGKELFNGPAETPEQIKAMPPELAVKLARAQATLPATTLTAQTLTLNGNVVAAQNQRARADGLMITQGHPPIAANTLNRPRVLTSIQKDTLLIARFETAKAGYLFAFNSSTGKTLFDGPVATPEQRKAMPAPLIEQLDLLEKNQSSAPEFGTVGR